VVLHGKTCGFGSTVTTKTDTPAGPQYLTAHQEEFVVKRLGTSLKIVETSKVTEDADGVRAGFLTRSAIRDRSSNRAACAKATTWGFQPRPNPAFQAAPAQRARPRSRAAFEQCRPPQARPAFFLRYV